MKMGNRIPRNATIMVCKFKFVNYGIMIVEKNDAGEWIGTDETGKKWHCFPSHLRNSDLCEIRIIK